MMFDVTSFVMGAIIGGLVVACIAIPRVGRLFTRIVATILLAAGSGLLIWAVVQDYRGAVLTPIVCDPIVITQLGEAVGWGGGLALSGLLALNLSASHTADR